MTGSRISILFGIFILLAVVVILLLALLHRLPSDTVLVTTPDGQTFERPLAPTDFTPPSGPPPRLPDEPDRTAPIACTKDAKQCPDGSAVGRVGPNCEFAACPSTSGEAGGTNSTMTTCDPSSRPEMCAEIYQPVCALVQVQCLTTPCDPVSETRGNACSACADQNVLSYTAGACPQ